jgi:2-polyprenyl-3-methyl-5-hydroxy-6-metoxy-1,4-benzoquinol methylase
MTYKGYKEFPCDLCGSTKAIEVPYAREYTNNQPKHICTECGFVYVKMRRSAKEIADTWSGDIFGSTYTAAIPAVKSRLTYVAEFIDQNLRLRNKNVCDIGSGEGVLLDMIRQEKYGAIVLGIEPSQKNCSKLEEMGIEHFWGTIEDFRDNEMEKRQKADLVTITWTLENCESCRGMLESAYDILKDNGHVVVATGSRLLVPFKKPLYNYLGKNPADTHAFHFSAKTLQGILAVSGFEVTHINRYLDSDILCMIARKGEQGKQIEWQGDNYLKVYNFFERWHVETKIYYLEEKI